MLFQWMCSLAVIIIGFTLATKARFPIPELTARVHGPSTRVVETGL